MEYSRHCDLLELEGARVVTLTARSSFGAPVPTCPGWDVSELLGHLGFVHRRAQYWVKMRVPERLSPREMNLSRGPVSADWMAEGTAALLGTLRASDPDETMWAWGADQHVRYWARRMLHETLVHRTDLEGALGEASAVDHDLGVDAIDEFFANVAYTADFSPAVRSLVGEGETIQFACEGGPSWNIQLNENGFEFIGDATSPDAQFRATSTELLLVLYGRRPLEGSSGDLRGRSEFVVRWLENSALQ